MELDRRSSPNPGASRRSRSFTPCWSSPASATSCRSSPARNLTGSPRCRDTGRRHDRLGALPRLRRVRRTLDLPGQSRARRLTRSYGPISRSSSCSDRSAFLAYLVTVRNTLEPRSRVGPRQAERLGWRSCAIAVSGTRAYPVSVVGIGCNNFGRKLDAGRHRRPWSTPRSTRASRSSTPPTSTATRTAARRSSSARR